jgi:polysaccharide biosynthesis protein PslG
LRQSTPPYPTETSRGSGDRPRSSDRNQIAPATSRESISSRLARSIVTDRALTGDMRRISRALVLLVLGLAMVLGAAVADAYLHRGIETSAEPPYVMHVSGRGLATNLDLRQFEPGQLAPIAETIGNAGFQYVRHPFIWAELQPEAGQYNWELYDDIVRSLSDQGIEIVAVVSDSPVWARNAEDAETPDAPPQDINTLQAFLEQFMNRYGQNIDYVQVWDRPNQPGNWGVSVATPSDYLGMLATSFNTIRTNDPDTRVIMAEFDPYGATGSLGDDVRFLRGMYEANGSPFFDVVAVSIDGGIASPYDRRVSGATQNLSRAILFREVLQDHADEGKPIWFTHYGWNAQENVDRSTQAEYLVAGIDRMRAEWPWVGLAFQWQLLPPDEGSPDVGWALLNPNGTATPAFSAVTELASVGLDGVAPTGFVPMDTGPVNYSGSWSDQHLTGRILRTTSEIGASVSLRFEGTGLVAYLRRSPDAGLIRATIDGEPLPDWEGDGDASLIDLTYYQAQDIAVTLASGLNDGEHEIVLSLDNQGRLTMGGAIISRDPPMLWPVVVGMISGLVLAIIAMRDLVFVIGRRNGWLLQREGVDLRPMLPRLPDWQPTRRA